jgi:hypothetical protein
LTTVDLRLLEGDFAMWKLPPDAAAPELPHAAIVSLTRTANELSVVSPASEVPPDVPFESGWRCLEVAGPLAFELTGILASISVPLADKGIPIFVVSTFDTDYVLVRADDLSRACDTLESAGHTILDEPV